jgi:hypothetical protein
MDAPRWEVSWCLPVIDLIVPVLYWQLAITKQVLSLAFDWEVSWCLPVIDLTVPVLYWQLAITKQVVSRCLPLMIPHPLTGDQDFQVKSPAS